MNCTKNLYSVLFQDTAHLYKVRDDDDGKEKTRSFLLHDETTASEVGQTSASVLLLQQEVKNSFKDCHLQKYLRGSKMYHTHITGIYVAYQPYESREGSNQFAKLAADPASLRGGNPDIINLKANLAYVR